jgi:hypothetical protein
MMILRTLGKLRNTPVADVLIHTLAKWGRDASCYAAAGAIAEEFSREHGLYYFTRELAQLNADRSAGQELRPPSGSTARLLLDTGSSLYRGNVLKDIQIFRTGLTSRGTDLPGGDTVGAALRPAPAPTELVNGPLVGRVRKVTRATMESLADTLGPGDIACLTEPRIVDALFEGVSGYLISHDEVDQPLGIRLAARSARFASYTADVLHELEDGTAMALWPSGRAGATPAGHVAAPASSSGQRRSRL